MTSTKEQREELIDDWAKNHKEPINANDVYQWTKFGFIAGD
jgi:hypothetical protein